MVRGFPVLIAATPRAGRFNHLNLLPPGPLPDGFKPADYLGAAGSTPVGPDYLAAVQIVAQVGTSREGREVLALVGVRVSDETERTRILEWLREKLLSLGREITGVDWAAHDGSDYRLTTLELWEGEVRKTFSLEDFSSRGTTSSPLARGWLKWVMAATLLSAVGFTLCLLLFGAKGANHSPPSTKAGTGLPKSSGPNEPAAKAIPWDAFVDDTLRGITPGNRDAEVEKLVGELGATLDRLEGHELPRFAKKTQAERIEALQRHPLFSAWLKDNYGPDQKKPFRAWIPATAENTKTVRTLTRIGGDLTSVWGVYQTTMRVEKYRKFLDKVRSLKIEKMDSKTRSDQPLLGWMEQVGESKAIEHRIPELPFLTAATEGRCLEVVESLDRLVVALDAQFKTQHEDKPVQKVWSIDSGNWARNVCMSQIKEWNPKEWASRDKEARQLVEWLEKVIDETTPNDSK